MNIKIGICDDNSDDLELSCNCIDRILCDVEVGYELYKYTSGNDFMNNKAEAMELDVLILDIDMPGIDGIEVAKNIADSNAMTNIIFATNHHELVFEAIHYRPFRFIRKEFLSVELEEAIKAVINKINEETMFIDFNSSHDNFKIKIKDIEYIESNGHYLCIHIGDTVKDIRGKISDYEDRLKNYGFIRVHLGYLVNVRSIFNITSRQVTLDNGIALPISRKNAENIKNTYASYIRRFVRGVN